LVSRILLAAAPFSFHLVMNTLAEPRGSGHYGPQKIFPFKVQNVSGE